MARFGKHGAVLGALLATGTTALAAVPVSVRAGTMTGGASEWTQVMNNVALLQQIIHAIRAVVQLKRQVEYMAKSVKDFASGRGYNVDQILNGFDSILGQTQGVLSQSRGLVFAGESIFQQWKQLHPGQITPDKLDQVGPDSYRALDQGIQHSVEKAKKTLDLHNKTDDAAVFAQLKTRIGSVEGQLQATKAGNEILLDILRVLLSLKQIAIAQANVMGEDVSSAAQRRQFDDALHERGKYTGKYRSLNPIDYSER
ncbi:MAG TPA: hypothetical protein VFX59_06115 [Polyangiales bacterium]|nr:hypothetical protein [Polyangiales bacterium]